MLNRKYIKLTLSTSLLGLLLFLSCDDRNPVSTPAPVILNELNLNIRNASCTGEDGEEDTCNQTAYAALNGIDQLKIELQLKMDIDEDGTFDLGDHLKNNQITFYSHQGEGDTQTSTVGEIEFCSSGSEGPCDNAEDGHNYESDGKGVTDSQGFIHAYWKDNGSTGTFTITALYEDGGEDTTGQIILKSPAELIGRIEGGTDSEENI